MIKVLNVSLPNTHYPISIGVGLLNQFDYFKLTSNKRVLIVTNPTIAHYYLDSFTTMFEQNGVSYDSVIIPDGEKFKTLDTWNTILTALLEKNHTRQTILIALGGGVIGDIAGFAASVYQRGINFIQVPTTLLAQVDSSVGGKTAINHPLGKNMIGTFYQPQSVVIDLNCLKTLPPRELSAGLAEVIKYGIILSAEFFTWLESHIYDLLNLDEHALSHCIHFCCELKANIVAQDEKEQGIRAILNLGHTYGHAIEAHLGYGNWLHGEAISVGILMAAHTAHLLGFLPLNEVNRIKHLLMKAKLPVHRPSGMSAESYLPHMLRDKKVLTGKLRLVIPTKIGHSKVIEGIDSNIVITAINQVQPA